MVGGGGQIAVIIMSSGSISLMTFLDSSSMSKIVTEFFGRYRSSSLLELATIDVIETSWESVTACTSHFI